MCRVRVGKMRTNERASEMFYNIDEAIAAVKAAPTLEDAKTIAKEYCDKRCACKLYGGASKQCTYCPLEEEQIERFYENHKVVVEQAKKFPRRRNKHTDGRSHNATTVQALYALLRRKYNSKHISMRGLAKKYFLEIAHKCGVPEKITSVQAAIIYAEKTTLRYKRKTIAQYMCDEFNERW